MFFQTLSPYSTCDYFPSLECFSWPFSKHFSRTVLVIIFRHLNAFLGLFPYNTCDYFPSLQCFSWPFSKHFFRTILVIIFRHFNAFLGFFPNTFLVQHLSLGALYSLGTKATVLALFFRHFNAFFTHCHDVGNDVCTKLGHPTHVFVFNHLETFPYNWVVQHL